MTIDKEMMERARKIASEFKDQQGIIAIPNVSYFQRKLSISYTRATEIHYALYGAKKQTNGDKIRAMSNEELAEFISEDRVACLCCRASHFCCDTNLGCKDAWLNWMNAPAESEENHG